MTPRRRFSDAWAGSELVRATVVCVVMVGLVLLGCCGKDARAAEPDRIVIPQASFLYRMKLDREVSSRFGSTEAVARIAAQVHVESRWDPKARSKYAEGMSQFTPATSKWLESICPEIGPPDPWSPDWSVRAVVCYDAWLHARVAGATACDRWAFALAAYNGGLGWISRDKNRASAQGADAARWFGHVELHTPRADWARRENRAYVHRILKLAEPAYIAAGWPGVTAC